VQGVILYGEPGTGKTLLAKAVANSTSATFLRVVGSELIQKYLGDGPKLVRELFRVADEQAPSIVFIGAGMGLAGGGLLGCLPWPQFVGISEERVTCWTIQISFLLAAIPLLFSRVPPAHTRRRD
jgi:hypothetical protein